MFSETNSPRRLEVWHLSNKVCPNVERWDHDMPKSITVDILFGKMKDLASISLTSASLTQLTTNHKIQEPNNPTIKKSNNPKNTKFHKSTHPTNQSSKTPKIQTLEICTCPQREDWKSNFQSLDVWVFGTLIFWFLFCFRFVDLRFVCGF